MLERDRFVSSHTGKGLRVHHQPWEVAVGYGRWASLDIFYEPVSHSDESQLDDARDKL